MVTAGVVVEVATASGGVPLEAVIGVVVAGVEVLVLSGVEVATVWTSVIWSLVLVAVVMGVDVDVVGKLVMVVVVEVVITGVEVAACGELVESVGVMTEGVEVAWSEPSVVNIVESVEVAAGSRTGSSRISGIIVDPRCLLSHSATAVTPSCQES